MSRAVSDDGTSCCSSGPLGAPLRPTVCHYPPLVNHHDPIGLRADRATTTATRASERQAVDTGDGAGGYTGEVATPAEQRPAVDHDVHTAELPPLPQRDSRIPVSRWVEAPDAVRHLGDDLGAEPGYLRRIGRYLLWRAGPATGADARYAAVAADDLDEMWTFRLFPDGTGEGTGPDGGRHARFRTWKEALRDASDP